MPAQNAMIAECMKNTAKGLRQERKGVIRTMQQLEDEMSNKKERFRQQSMACWSAQGAYIKAIKDERETRKVNTAKIEQFAGATERLLDKTKHEFQDADRMPTDDYGLG